MWGSPKDHLDEDVLELYSLGRLREDELEKVEEHLLVCPECQDRLREVDARIAEIRQAMASLREQPISFARNTRTGPVHLEVTRSQDGWKARVWGGGLDLVARFQTVLEANEYVLKKFAEFFPDLAPED